jgi:AcrR family transcriptional regulator
VLSATRLGRQRSRGKGDLRTALLRSARRLYFAHGAEGVSARKIAEAVGVSATTLYLHFEGIEDVLDQLRIEGQEVLARYLRSVDPKLPAPKRIRAMGEAYYQFGLENPQYFDLMFGPKPGGPRRREAVQREMFTLLLLRDAVQAGIATGTLRSDLDLSVATNALWAEIHGVTTLAVAGLLIETAKGHAEEVLEAVLDAAERWLLPASKRNTVK